MIKTRESSEKQNDRNKKLNDFQKSDNIWYFIFKQLSINKYMYITNQVWYCCADVIDEGRNAIKTANVWASIFILYS